jgi:hypothetical protein
MKQLVADAYARSLQILRDNKSLIEKMAGLLGEKEYITREEFDEIMAHADDADAIITRLREEYKVSLAQIESVSVVQSVVEAGE